MSQVGDGVDTARMLESVLAREREAREALIRVHDQLVARDERFAAVEAELWAGFEDHERRRRAEITELEGKLEEARRRVDQEVADRTRERESLQAELDRRHDEYLRVRLRLDRLLATAPFRLWRGLQRMPGVRKLRSRREQAYDRALSARRRH